MGRRILAMFIFVVAAAGAVVLVADYRKELSAETDRPWAGVELRPPKTDHSFLFKVDKFESGREVTEACISCHEDEATDFMKTQHWNWVGDETTVPGHGDKKYKLGKKNLINNFCIGIESNWPKCTTCHAGYGWKDSKFDFSDPLNIDCLICHDQSGQYYKDPSGMAGKDADLLAAAKSVGPPTRDNCGWCHFNGGGGNAVKHGDLDGSLAKPVERVDVHMGRADLQCIDCHKTENHNIGGRGMSVSIHGMNDIQCTDCHNGTPHASDRLNDHVETVACQACHVPNMAVKEATKVAWDWSTAGKDTDITNPHEYLKIKGSFIYAKQVAPEYYWFNGSTERYLKGDIMNPDEITHINYPMGDISDPNAKIWPFKVHRAKQPYDEINNQLLIPKTVGKGGYWTDFDWDQAAELAFEDTGIPFSGELGFTETDMYWPQTHMVSPKENALQCNDCHGENGRFNWGALGYSGDPAFNGGRRHERSTTLSKGADR